MIKLPGRTPRPRTEKYAGEVELFLSLYRHPIRDPKRPMANALILIGAPGAGKSSVLEALATQLEIDGVEHGAVEVDELARGVPWLTLEECLPILAGVVAHHRAAGRSRFLVAATPETDAELRAVVSAVGAGEPLVVCLTAPAGVVATRVADREPDRWPGKAALVAHAAELATVVPALRGIDRILSTDGRSAHDVASEIREAFPRACRGQSTEPQR
jgi:chloramphenicol 3-O-phosphotransferase